MRGSTPALLALGVAVAAIPCPPCGQWGYCDGSVGRCICAPGRNGTNCAQLHFGACRLHEEGEMACMTFRGLQSCACRRECEKRFGGVSRRHAQICWDWASGAVRPAHALTVNLSDFPEEPSAVVFRTSSWPPMGKCTRPKATAEDLRRCANQQTRGARRVANILGGSPVANRHCPLACSRRGTCLMPQRERAEAAIKRYPLQLPASGGTSPTYACVCHAGYLGEGCERTETAACFGGCSGHGACVGRFCLCQPGWQGVDCSLASSSLAVPAAPTKYAPTFVYPLPTSMSLEHVYQRDQDRRGQYYANLQYLQQLLSRKDSVVADPEQACVT